MNEFEKKHRKQKLSNSSLPFLLSNRNSSASISPHASISNEANTKINRPLITPNIREPYFGQTLGGRSNSQMEIGSDASNGPPDLVHWGRYFGSRSSQFLTNDFGSDKWKTDVSYRKDDDGYVGFYHFINGLNFATREAALEDYICELVGLEKENHEYFWKKRTDLGYITNFKKEMVVTYCTYNIFSKSDFRAKFIIRMSGSSKTSPIKIEKLYQIIPNSIDSRNRKVYSFNTQTIKNLAYTYWEELSASEIIRLFSHLDNPANQITGLVSYSKFMNSKSSIMKSAKLLVKFLNRASLTETEPAVGSVTGIGAKSESNRKTNQYKNCLIDCLIRLCMLDISGEVSDASIKEIRRRYYSTGLNEAGEWDIVILKLLKLHGESNKEKECIRLIHKHVKSVNIHNTQLAMVLLEQVKFLISKDDYDFALKIAKICIKILPLDFECWYNLTLCYILVRDYKNALLVLNSIPVILSQKQKNLDIDSVCGMKDLFLSTFIDRLNQNQEVISEKTFESYFPKPKVYASEYPRHESTMKKSSSSDGLIDEGSIHTIWNELFLFNLDLRHPINGNQFYQSTLMNSSPRELSSVDPNLIKLCGPSSAKIILSAQSAGSASSSIIDFQRKSTWGRCYDLLSFLVAIIGWDDLIHLKEEVFKSKTVSSVKSDYIVDNNVKENTQEHCQGWLDQLFLVIYEDLRSLMVIMAYDKEQHHSALEWEMLGILGWTVKYNLKESISSLMTSVMGAAAQGGFDYFGTVKLLEAYDEFVLSEVNDCNTNNLHDDYELTFHSHKLLLKLSGDIHDDFIQSLENDYLTLDFILLNLLKLISWNVRWYQYIPNYMVTKILTKLCIKYDLVFIRSKIKVVFEQNKRNSALHSKQKKSKFSFSSILRSSKQITQLHEFLDSDTIIDYTERIIGWLDGIKKPLPIE